MGLWTRRRPKLGRKLTTPDGLPAVTLPADYLAALQLYGLRGTYGQIYRTQPNVRSVVDFVAREVQGINLKLYEKVPAGPFLPSGRLELPDHPLQQLLNEPAPDVTRSRHWKATVSDLLIYNVAYWLKVRVDGRVRAVIRVPPPDLIPDRDPVTQRIRWYYATRGRQLVPLENLVVFAGYDPEHYDGSVSPLETLRRTLAEEAAAGRNREGMWNNSTRKSGVVERPPDAPPWSPEARDAWRADWEATVQGARNSGRVALLEDGMRWVEASWNPEQMQYLEARRLTRQECSAAFGVDPALVFASDREAKAETRTGFYVDYLAPLLTQLAEEIDLQLLPDFEVFREDRTGKYTEFNIDEKLRGSFEEQAKILVMTTGRAITTPNEARARLNLPPEESGDGLTIPMNVATGGQAGPLSPLEAPGPMPALGQTPGPGATPRASTTPLFTKEQVVQAVIAAVQAIADVVPPVEETPLLKTIRQEGDRWCVYSEDGETSLGCYDTRPEAVERLRQVEGNKAAETAPADVLPSAPEPALRRRRETASRYEEILRRHFERQGRTIRALAGATEKARDRIDSVWVDGARWDRELAADLRDLTETVVDDNARRAMRQVARKQTYDPQRTRAYIAAAVAGIATNINRKTRDAVAAALADESGEELESVFDTQAVGRAALLATYVATSFVNFGRLEGGKQAGATTKTWVVTSRKSRHPEMNGETAEVGEDFSNGLPYPGAAGDPDESANCQCLLDIS